MMKRQILEPHWLGIACTIGFCFGIALVPYQAAADEGKSAEPAVEEVANWDFGTEETTKLEPHGGVHRDQPGPRPPEFPDFSAENTCVRFDGDGSYFSFDDPGDHSPYDFTKGETITLEAWVNVETLRSGDNFYVIGKGRTGRNGFARDNQNWAIRVREGDGFAHLNFLFASVPSKGEKGDAHWHRWTSHDGFLPGSGWHHLAVVYKFGEPESLQGWIDGTVRKGAWDMGGATKAAPINDNDAIWIGSAQGGSSGSSFRGLIDEVAIHRGPLSAQTLKARFHREGPPRDEQMIVSEPPEVESVPQKVHFTFHEGLTAHNRWMLKTEKLSSPIATWTTDRFVLHRIPHRYDAWGIRESWKPPVLVRASTEVDFPAGTQTLLLRSRGLSRLWLDDQLVAATKPLGGSTDGHQPVNPYPEPPLPGLRSVGYGDQEVRGEVELKTAGRHRLVLESIVGGQKYRPEPGELLVALLTADGKSYELVQHADNASLRTPLTDPAIIQAMAVAETELKKVDDFNRRTAADSQADFWKQRHAQARLWVTEHPGASIPGAVDETHAIDRFIQDKISRAIQASAGQSGEQAAHFHDHVLPVLRENCFRCHGEKDKGGLRLNSLAASLQGGDSGEPALVPHQVEASQLVARIRSEDEGDRMPPSGKMSSQEIAVLEQWIKEGAQWPAPPVNPDEIAAAPLVDDASFLRRVFLDTVGVPPSEQDLREFLADRDAGKRDRMIDRLLQDERFADHWVSYWQDVLAENPNILKPSLNNTGPFRWFLYESLRDGRPLDRMVTELLMLRGSEREGGSAGFGFAADNDAPFAAKGHVLASAFLGIELQCARCHDSPYHSTTQRDLFSLAAMLARKNVSVPATSTVSPGFFEKNKGRDSLIQVTLKPGEPVTPTWPFAEVTGVEDTPALDNLLQKPTDSRERLAALVTAPANERFANVIVNRVWKRLLGAGFVEPAHDWEGREISHPELLNWLSRQFVGNGYDFKHLVRLIMSSQTYQRAAIGKNLTATAELRFFSAPEQRRLSAEQIVDSLYTAAGRQIEVESLTFDQEAKRPANTMINLGVPERSWMFTALSNERDRPSLALPRAQAVTDVLEAFGWTGSRQNPQTDREVAPNVLQPGVLSNSVLVTWISRASYRSELADLAVRSASPQALVESIYLRFLGRLPNSDEQAIFVPAIAEGFEDRLLPSEEVRPPEPLPPLSHVSWSNHLSDEANLVKLEAEKRARAGEPPDPRLRASWREIYEDLVWSAVNSPEFVWIP